MKYEKLYIAAAEFEKFADAAVRERGSCVFPSEHSSVKDNKDHFPINDEAQARNALARVNQYTSVPSWYNGSLSSLVNAVSRAVKSKFKSIEVSEKSFHPGKD